jgi:hypothetical protein
VELADQEEKDDLRMPFDDQPEPRKTKIREIDTSYPDVDDIYDWELLTNPDHKLLSLNKDALLHKLLSHATK